MIERYKQSLLIINSQIDHGGGIVAANDTDISVIARDTYSYVWPRDGALVSSALMHAGHAGAPERFLAFCARVVSPNGYLRHKYNPDGSLASTWHGYVHDGKAVLPIQEDETALVIWALGEYFDLYRRIEETAPFYRGLVTRPADFLLSHVDQSTGLPLPSYDLWEERWGVHTFTVAAVIAGLRAASRLATEFGETERSGRYLAAAERMLEGARAVLWNEEKQRFARMATPGPSGYTLDMTADASIFGLVLLGALAGGRPSGGVHHAAAGEPALGADRRRRHGTVRERLLPPGRAKGHHAGPRQPLVRVHHVAGTVPASAGPDPGRPGRGFKLLEWAAERALPSGTMAEQLHPYTGEPLSVSPLTWSHAEYVRTVREYIERFAGTNLCPAAARSCVRPSVCRTGTPRKHDRAARDKVAVAASGLRRGAALCACVGSAVVGSSYQISKSYPSGSRQKR